MLHSRVTLMDGIMMLGSLHSVDLVQLVVMGRAGNIVLGVVLIGLHTVDLVQTVIVGWARSIIPAQVRRAIVGR